MFNKMSKEIIILQKEHLYDNCLGINLTNLIFNSLTTPSILGAYEIVFGRWDFNASERNYFPNETYIDFLFKEKKISLSSFNNLETPMAERFEKSILKKGIPVLIFINEFYCNWAEKYYQKKDNIHAALLTLNNEEYRIKDGWYGNQVFKLNNEDYISSRTSVNNQMIFVNEPTYYSPVIDNFKQFLALANEVMSLSGNYRGFCGIYKIIDDIKKDQFNISKFYLKDFLQFVCQRKGLFTYIQHALYNYFNELEISRIINLTKILISEWIQLPAILFKYLQTGYNKIKLINILESIINHEKKLLYKLVNNFSL